MSNSISDVLKTGGEFSYTGIADDMIKLAQIVQLKDKELWNMVSEQFSDVVDDEDNGWRCEYWGKLMRGACVVYQYTKDKELYDILEHTVRAVISHSDSDGRIATYSKENEFHGWDMWGRKYVLLGLIYFYEICSNVELAELVLNTAQCQLDYIINHVGKNIIEITDTSDIWGGINSSSILEPTVKLYCISGDKRYLDFAEYIVNNGGAKGFNIFEAAYEDKLYPYEYPVTKAYELMSCFDGLIEYYKVTGIEKWKIAAENFAKKLRESEITIIGSAGCKHELFNHSSLMQTYTGYSGLMQETCVTVTWIRLCFKLLLLTGDSVYGDEIEKSVYNALYGAVNTEGQLCGDEATFDEAYYRDVYDTHHAKYKRGQIFDSYSPLRLDIRGKAVGGFKPMRNKTSYCGCCIAIGAVGIGLVPQMSVLNSKNGFNFMLYIPGKASMYTEDGTRVDFEIKTDYPSRETVDIFVKPEINEEFTVSLRIPYFAKCTSVKINGEAANGVKAGGMLDIKRVWSKGDKIEISFDMNLRLAHGMENPNDSESQKHIAVFYGPLALTNDARLGEVGKALEITEQKLDINLLDAGLGELCNCTVQLDDNELKMIDYASAGKTWRRDSEMEVWIKTK
jgi:DUF1680 family protein